MIDWLMNEDEREKARAKVTKSNGLERERNRKRVNILDPNPYLRITFHSITQKKK